MHRRNRTIFNINLIFAPYDERMKPLRKVRIAWSPEFAYAIGLLATDGNLSPDGRHINLTSKDKDQIQNFLRCLKIPDYHIGMKNRESEQEKKYFVVQIGDICFYSFLVKIGITPHKSKTLRGVAIPDQYFFDFLRGSFDGDGTFYSYWDSRWKSSFMFYTEFISASRYHINWIRRRLNSQLDISGHITADKNGPTQQLKYAKTESLKLLPKLYYNPSVVCLSRKRRKIEEALAIEGKYL